MHSSKFLPAALLGLLSACADASPTPHASDVSPLIAFDEQATDEGSVFSACELGSLAVSYVDDESPGRGRIRVALTGESSAKGQVEVEVQGRSPVLTPLAEDQLEVLSAARIQDAVASDGEISVHVRVALECGASVENVFVFEDPIQHCGAPELASIAGNEAQFYQCAERWAAGGKGCGAQGYLLGYGERYAQKFYFETRPRMGSRGKDFIDHVLVCLQHELREAIHVDTSCDDIKRTAFDQHPRCYAENGFCTLPIGDALQVPATIDGRDLFSKDGLRQLIGIVPQCGRQYQLALAFWLAGRR